VAGSRQSDLGWSVTGDAGRYPERGVFVAFEGGEGSGKSTQARLLADWLRNVGPLDVVLTHEPGGSAIGQRLRAVLLDPQSGSLSDRAETLLYAADKAQHLDEVLAPALARGATVVSDRYVDSTLAYQGAGRGLPPRQVERIARWATLDLRPHLTVLLDLPPQTGLSRVDAPDRLEAEPLAFHERVRSAFLALADADPEHYLVVDAGLPAGTIAERVRRRVAALLQPDSADRSRL
jgi:dTMP kinase